MMGSKDDFAYPGTDIMKINDTFVCFLDWSGGV